MVSDFRQELVLQGQATELRSDMRELHQEAQFLGLKSGNYGLWDQRLALEWTHANIVGFGGNPRNITVGGYSGGTYSTFLQLQYDLTRPVWVRSFAVWICNPMGQACSR